MYLTQEILNGMPPWQCHAEPSICRTHFLKRELAQDCWSLHASLLLTGLHSEQKALLDLLVISNAATFVGYLRSSFSCFARDLRALRHQPRNSSIIFKVGEIPASVLQFQELIACAGLDHACL